MRRFLILALFALSACSGSDEQTSFSSLNAKFTDIDNRAVAAGTMETSVMPTSGTATYNGAVAYSNTSVYMVSGMQVKANFANNTANATLNNFVLADETHLSGQITMKDGTIIGTSLIGPLSGALAYQSSNTVPVTGNLDGTFYRDDASLIGANINFNVAGVSISGFGAAEK